MEFRAATLADYAALFPARSHRSWQIAAVQILSGPAWTLWRGDKPRLICGLYPLEGRTLEAWLFLPAGVGGELATLRFLLSSTAAVFPDRDIIARIDDGNFAGRRLALLAGFLPLEEFLGGTAKRTWRRKGYPYVYRWDRQERKGRFCRVNARGGRNSIEVEFEDGYTMITSGNALRKRDT